MNRYQLLKFFSITPLLIWGLSLSNTWAKNYQTLPQGRSTFGYKYVVTDKIIDKIDNNGNRESYSIKEEIDAKQLESINSTFKNYFEILNQIAPEAYQAFNLGEYKVEAEGNVKAQGIGMGHGFTHRLTGYFALPLYRANSKINLKQTKFSNMDAVKNALLDVNPANTSESLIKQFTEQLPEASGEVLQSLITNYYGYKPLGTWSKSAPGDLELGFIYNLVHENRYGTALAFGTVLPTGQADDPDNLQDIATGDGQSDLFVENLSGLSLIEGNLELDLRTRYTHQLAEDKYMRLPENADFPLSKHKEYINEKLGNKMEGELTLTTTFFESVSQSIGVLYQSKESNRYETKNLTAKEILEKNSNEKSVWLKTGIKFSSIEFFKNNSFFVPFDIGGSYQTLIQGKNTADYHRLDVDFRLYF